MLPVISLASPPRGFVEGELTTSEKTQNRPRLAASSYLNTAPLIWSFQHGTRRDAVELVTDAAPAYCADLLAGEQVEAALVPVIEYQRMDGVVVVPDVCVGSHRAVRSVILVSRHEDLKNVRRVALDVSSRTSQALVKIIFREFLNTEPECQSNTPELRTMLETNDAALLIGDPAMKIQPQGVHVFDLASLWHEFTGTGFVFAMWMAAAGAAKTIVRLDLAGARDEGLEQIDSIVADYENEVPWPIAEIRSYLTDNITFNVDQSLAKGLQLYFELAQKHGLIKQNKPLEFIVS